MVSLLLVFIPAFLFVNHRLDRRLEQALAAGSPTVRTGDRRCRKPLPETTFSKLAPVPLTIPPGSACVVVAAETNDGHALESSWNN